MKSFAIKLSYALVCVCLVLALVGSTTPVYAASIIYVDADSACSSSCGGSWASAYSDLQSAFAVAGSGDEIWVAEGVYYPDEGTGQTDNDTHSIFTLINGVSIYGGFAGNESMVGQRDATLHPAILSGDIDKNDLNTDGNNIAETYADIQGVNAWHVTLGSFTDSTAVLDGFTITAGFAPGGYASSTVPWVDSGNGGGMLVINGSPTLSHLIFSGNVSFVNGGGLFSGLDPSFPGASNPTLTDIAFNGNYSVYGGGMFNLSSNPSMANFTFSNNTANWGGGLYNKLGDPVLVNFTFSTNQASNLGGGMFVESGSPILTNLTFSGNAASSGGGMYNDNGNPTLINTILANSTNGGDCNTSLYSSLSASSSNNLIEDSVNACGLANGMNGNIIGSDPNLGPLANNGGFTRTLALLSGSPAIDAGTNTGCPATDQRGLTRPQGMACDIGAFEITNLPPVAEAGGPYLSAVNADLQFDSSSSSDPEDDTLSYTWDFGDDTTGMGESPAHSYTMPGIYDVCLTANDGSQDSEPVCTLVVIYDPEGGFVTGGGWIDSPAGAYTADPSLTGKATFGFVSKYKKGANVPSGNTEFQFQAGGFNFHSDTYEWLVVNQAGTNAQFKGSGTVNDAPDSNGSAYKFMLWAGDGSPDTFRIQIWYEDETGEYVVYDNGVDQATSGGSIVVHNK